MKEEKLPVQVTVYLQCAHVRSNIFIASAIWLPVRA
jgi:hypothetical protein